MYFLKDRPDLLHLIKRKAHSRTEGKTKALPHHEGSADVVPHSEPIFNESKHRNARSDHDRKHHAHDDQTRRIQELEAQQTALVSENQMLKRIISEMRYKQEELSNKTDGILKVLYHMYLTSVFIIKFSLMIIFRGET